MKHQLHLIIAVLAMLVVLATGCSRDSETFQPSEEEILANAEAVLGVKISPEMDWNMTASALARIAVKGSDGETFTVKIYSNDPLTDGKGYVLKRQQVKSGDTLQLMLEYPSVEDQLVVSVTDKQGFNYYKSVPVSDGKLETTFVSPYLYDSPYLNDDRWVVSYKRKEQPAVWTYAFEDTPLGDYDLNDVVLKVSENVTDTTKLEVRLCCAGASFDLYVYLGETPVFNGKEVHAALGQNRGLLLNTGKGPEVNAALLPLAYIDKPEGFTFANADFWIKSPIVPTGIHVAKTGKAPLGVVIPGDWQWPLENVCIKEAYSGFVSFAENVQDESDHKWYKVTKTTPLKDKVYAPQTK
ncbi:MAG: DUF4842 domain-containing protein [Prevotella sp.]|nr:DUF4842 domain-containing protein [Prevotella sp.]